MVLNITERTGGSQMPRTRSSNNDSFASEFDPLALWGFMKLLMIGLLESSSFYIFAVTLTLVDLIFVVLNLISPSRTRENVIPRAFSPTSPPPFLEHPFVYCLCKLTFWLGDDAPDWMQQWARWEGLTSDGRWPPVDRNLALDHLSRSPCPALNALANHGILNQSGEGLSFHQIAAGISRAYNLSPTLAIQLLSAAWPLFKDQNVINLESLTVHGLIEHDASLLRPDLHESSVKAQTKPDQELIERYFSKPKINQDEVTMNQRMKLRNQSNQSNQELKQSETKNESRLNHLHFSLMLNRRRNESKIGNRSFVQNFLFKFFGSGNCAMLIEVFKGDLSDIRAFIGAGVPMRNHRHQHLHLHHQAAQAEIEKLNLDDSYTDLINFEVLPFDRWRPSTLHHPWGLTICKLIYSAFKVEART